MEYLTECLFTNTNKWIPKYKWELVRWLEERYPKDAKRFNRMRKRQLLAIYFAIRGMV